MKSRKKCRLLPPNVAPSGRKKTVYANCEQTAKLLQRKFDHLKEFLYAELGTTGAVSGERHLILKGRFRDQQIRSILRKYADEYVICPNCLSPETDLIRDNATRLSTMSC
eukprot:UN23743